MVARRSARLHAAFGFFDLFGAGQASKDGFDVDLEPVRRTVLAERFGNAPRPPIREPAPKSCTFGR